MFVYQGKLDWYSYAKDETFVIVLPNGPVRVGDSVYLFSQWTEDAQRNKKRNWFDTIVVDSVTQTQATDVTFYLKGAWYNYTVTTQGGYKSLSVVMRNPTNGVSKPLPLQRIWESKQELTGTTRIWTGKFSWMHFAKDEPAIFIVPDGFGEGKPILSLWQYTQDSAGKLKDPSFRNEVQKSVSGIGTDVVKFSYHSYYDISCTWEAKTDKLAVHVKEGSHGEDVGSMIRSAIIERQAHTHDFDPPEPTPGKTEVEVRLPQPQPSLPRILGPLPFPKGIIDTLAHTAAFVDQAGYLAKYAQDRFAALDADYHALLQQLKAAQADITNLNKTKEDLTLDRDAARAKAKKLEDDLAAARKEADELRKKIQDLEKYIHDDKIQDEGARKILKETQEKLTASQAEVTDLKQKLSKAQGDIEALNARIAKLLEKVIKQQTTISHLDAELDVQTKKNKELTKENGQLKSANSELEAAKNKTQGLLDRANKRIAELEQTVKDQQGDIENLIKEKDDAQSKVSAAQKARAKAEADLGELKKKAYDAGIDF
ncbi:hypothetical protein MRS44_006852 [Fusarium solani]|uniref:Uncharacterized protein n=1 Tax=Fusarium solani TaxID=169388 RepID=A0A9P9RDK4_FUSSL|nr:uncharacterized protein B0J15DRAFT_531004 [Fusarium solani]KAH7274899.1 hypothetical protein B0J15DRAFT_531004 [Fusarium solani]KAJ3466194.1 hypothetical protein MRS44_006852 [Fusarium solani]